MSENRLLAPRERRRISSCQASLCRAHASRSSLPPLGMHRGAGHPLSLPLSLHFPPLGPLQLQLGPLPHAGQVGLSPPEPSPLPPHPLRAPPVVHPAGVHPPPPPPAVRQGQVPPLAGAEGKGFAITEPNRSLPDGPALGSEGGARALHVVRPPVQVPPASREGIPAHVAPGNQDGRAGPDQVSLGGKDAAVGPEGRGARHGPVVVVAAVAGGGGRGGRGGGPPGLGLPLGLPLGPPAEEPAGLQPARASGGFPAVRRGGRGPVWRLHGRRHGRRHGTLPVQSCPVLYRPAMGWGARGDVSLRVVFLQLLASTRVGSAGTSCIIIYAYYELVATLVVR